MRWKIIITIFVISIAVMAGCEFLPKPPKNDDKTPPTIISVSPKDGAENVPINTSIIAEFSETMDESATENAFTILPSIPGAFMWSRQSTVLTFKPDSYLSTGTTYTAKIGTGAKDLAGNALEAAYIWIFMTGSTTDNIPPGDVTNFTATPGDGKVDLSWVNPTDSDFVGVKIVFKTDGYPAGPADGMEAYNGSETSHSHTGLTNGTTYYYTAFAYDSVQNYSNGKQASATPGGTLPVYSTDFSSDPEWTTSDPSRFYWDSGQKAYYMNRININGGGNYAVKDVGVNMASRSFLLEWDIKVVSVDYACGLQFGLFDTDMDSDSNGSYVWVVFGSEDRGYQVLMQSVNASNQVYNYWDAGPQYSLNTWYHVVLDYNALTGQLRADVINLDTGVKLRSFSITSGPFASDMDRVGISDIRQGSYQVPEAQAKGYIDNVQFYLR